MAKMIYGFSEAAPSWTAKTESALPPASAAPSSGGSHGASGMYAIIDLACGDMKGYREALPGCVSGSIQAHFGRMHPAVDIPEEQSSYEAKLRDLANSMEVVGGGDDGPADAGQTFLGQFIDHDLTLDATTDLGVVSGDVSKIRNFRTPRLDLDCVYGGGRDVSRHLYDNDDHAKLLFGRETGEGHADGNSKDLARNRQGNALIGDPRNDENIFVSQVHGRMFVEEHNKLVDGGMNFKDAQKAMIRRYHEMIVDEFLPAVVDKDVLKPFVEWLKGGPVPSSGYVYWDKIPDMPVEFSAAAYRFGHSMVRERYKLNDAVGVKGIFNDGLEGFAPVEEANNIDLDAFFGSGAQPARAIDTDLPPALINLPNSVTDGGEANLAFRNMQRGHLTFRLPSGEQMADYMGYAPIPTHPKCAAAGLTGHTPLWFYILAEAESGDGKEAGKLGKVGGSIVAGTIVNLLIKGESELVGHLSLTS